MVLEAEKCQNICDQLNEQFCLIYGIDKFQGGPHTVMMPAYDMDMPGMHYRHGKDIDFIHKK